MHINSPLVTHGWIHSDTLNSYVFEWVEWIVSEHDQPLVTNDDIILSEFTPDFYWGSCYLIFSFMCMFCKSLFVLLYFFLWSLCCLFFFDILILITPLVSSNSSFKLCIVLSHKGIQFKVKIMSNRNKTCPNQTCLPLCFILLYL